jgi:hypothetical protein
MAKTTRLDGERLRELARIRAEVTLTRFRAEIVAIERDVPELKLASRETPPGASGSAAVNSAGGTDEDTCDWRRARRDRAGSLRADRYVVGPGLRLSFRWS